MSSLMAQTQQDQNSSKPTRLRALLHKQGEEGIEVNFIMSGTPAAHESVPNNNMHQHKAQGRMNENGED